MGEFAAVETIVKLPLNVFTVIGANRIGRLHVLLGTRIVPLTHVAPVLEKGEAGLPTVVSLRFWFPVFVTTMVFVKLPFTAMVPKSTGFGEALIMGPFEVPDRFTVTLGWVESFEGILKLSLNVPSLVGANIMVIEHVAFCARVCPEQLSALLL